MKTVPTRVWIGVAVAAALILTLQIFSFLRHVPPGDAAGRIVAKDNKGVIIQDRKGHLTQVIIDEVTLIESARLSKRPDELVSGTYLVVMGESLGDGTIHARIIRLFADEVPPFNKKRP
ncbi:MAG: hypothetical protein KBE09_04485 [Candidatus Pacebacteria bacterium]|nr:hypothetical protein [Candidatus Paceibacterota bacterium]